MLWITVSLQAIWLQMLLKMTVYNSENKSIPVTPLGYGPAWCANITCTTHHIVNRILCNATHQHTVITTHLVYLSYGCSIVQAICTLLNKSGGILILYSINMLKATFCALRYHEMWPNFRKSSFWAQLMVNFLFYSLSEAPGSFLSCVKISAWYLEAIQRYGQFTFQYITNLLL